MAVMDLQDYTKAVDTYADSVYRVAYSYTYTKVDAEDVLQNVFFKLFQSKQSFSSEEHLRQWLIHVLTVNCPLFLLLLCVLVNALSVVSGGWRLSLKEVDFFCTAWHNEGENARNAVIQFIIRKMHWEKAFALHPGVEAEREKILMSERGRRGRHAKNRDC